MFSRSLLPIAALLCLLLLPCRGQERHARLQGDAAARDAAGATFDSVAARGTPFKDCPPEGSPGSDTAQNLAKNRDAAPARYEDVTVLQLLAMNPRGLAAASGGKRSRMPRAQRDTMRRYEARGVRLEGYLLLASQSGPENCNCDRNDLRDWHLVIGARRPATPEDAAAMRAASVVTEPTPRWQARMGWRLRQMKALARQGARVRISGWLFWDQRHPERLPTRLGSDATRGTLWEVHPVTRIEVYSDGRWIELRGE